MWRSRHNSYRGDGAYGQFILVLPEQDAVIAITAETPDMQGEINLVWKYILPSFSSGKLPADRATGKKLRSRLASLALTPPVGIAAPSAAQQVSGKSYSMFTNDRRLNSLSAYFSATGCELVLNTDSVVHKLNFGPGKWVYNETVKFGPYLVAGARANRVGLPPFKIAGSYSWKDEKTVEFILRYIESPHHEVITCTFEDDYVNTTFRSSFDKKERTSKGVLRKTVANPPRLIVRGDDMGFSHSGNLALVKSYREGIETSIEVIAPSPWFPEAVKLLQQNPRADVGLHFAITSEWDNIKWRPLSDCPSITNEDGYFYPMLYKNRNYPGQAVLDHEWKIEDIERELRAQIKLAQKYIPGLTHISGHMGATGFDPNVKAMVARVASEFNLSTVDSDPSKNQFNYARAELQGKNTEQRIEAFVTMLNGLEDGKTYVFVEHPGLNDDELKAISHIGYTDVAEDRQDVTTIFTSEKVREAIARKGIQLVSYEDVLKPVKTGSK
ncbi:MAG: polysaccharide deacetylase family protein [Chryseolinea sp.]